MDPKPGMGSLETASSMTAGSRVSADSMPKLCDKYQTNDLTELLTQKLQ